MNEDWFSTSWPEVSMILLSTAVVYPAILLMAGSTIFDENLDKAKVTRHDLFAKLREANALTYDQILAVVFETTGNISVLHASNQQPRLERDFFAGVEDADRLFETQPKVSDAAD